MTNEGSPSSIDEEKPRKVGGHKKGEPLSEETKRKMSLARKGKPHSKEHRENIGKALKGRVITPEWREKLRFAAEQRIASPATKLKMSESHTGEKNHFFGKHHSDETKKIVSETRIRTGCAAGENNPMYIDGSSFEPYCPRFNNDLRRRVRAFFKDTCQLCGHVKRPGEKNMAVHHVNYNKEACCNNGVKPLFVTLCSDGCHVKTNHDRDYWEICFTQLINGKYNGKCYFSREEYYEQRCF
jgi:hypothetical protein